MKLVIEISNSLYANLKTIKHGSIASSRIFECVKNGTPLTDCTDAISREAVMKLKTRIDKYGDMIYAFDVNRLPSINPTTDLSKIRAEIIDKYMTADGRMGSVSADILKIIDKYSKGGESDA